MNFLKKLALRRELHNKTVLKFVGEGCQARDEFAWVGKVIDFKDDNVIIKIIKHNFSYTDTRDGKEEETMSWPINSPDLQYVDGIWILFR